MRRICTTLVVASSLLVAASPVQAKTVSHRHEVRATASQSHVTKTQGLKRAGTANHVQKFTYGRT